MLKGKNVLLGVCGSIAAYKAALITRELVKKGANVNVLMTPSSAMFITPLTLSTLSKNPVYLQYADEKTGEWNNHVSLAKWADFMLISPATQNTIAKMANGICDNLLLATYFSMEKKVFFAPAMDLDMHAHESNRANIEKLQSYGNILIPAGSGELASGLYGDGRMAEVDQIMGSILGDKLTLSDKKILITAGPTIEKIDPVRYIANHSSGKMGYALARKAKERGAKVTLISGPTSQTPPNVDRFISVSSAEEMFRAVEKEYEKMDVFISAAAVSDYTIANSSDQKIKKQENSLELKLQPTKDILKFVGEHKKTHQFVIGFALETTKEEFYAQKKLEKKNCDIMVLNSMNNSETTFGGDRNQITIFDRNNNKKEFELKSKEDVASDILDYMELNWLKT